MNSARTQFVTLIGRLAVVVWRCLVRLVKAISWFRREKPTQFDGAILVTVAAGLAWLGWVADDWIIGGPLWLIAAGFGAAGVERLEGKRDPKKAQPSSECQYDESIYDCPEEAECDDWLTFSDKPRFMLAAYRKGKGIEVDVLEVNNADLDYVRKKPVVVLEVSAPKRVRERVARGEYVEFIEWERDFRLRRDRLLWFEPLHTNFDGDGEAAYSKAIKRGLRAAKRL